MISVQIIIITNKPQAMAESFTQQERDRTHWSLAPSDLTAHAQAAGLDMAALSRWLGGHRQIVRCMPNTPALFDEAISAYSAGRFAGPEAVRSATEVLSSVGQTLALDEPG